ncbi:MULTISPECIES: 4-(cytidine 5'-diphospho)-2-C-methyl-D-erythritol kinase [unclassified Synechococcus]|uniref:4-(cytidine 5'-diphospho)-2-C-methyl-D-erythritol kinase n=1 Tax=unclassified Synechococcus TaxID=2626047 RepID=UPI002AD53B57|nr:MULTISPECIES: 4-(cytidine 5'-diphospho)-2-C-methyl-D-erythritol kinase [unclassified Synechococcus]MEA5423011.1 4-(cytidine 5'-diphospho)-2-C-methyl-D-erythritol kinase [Synechococcus sp. CCY9202]CAK6695470.1 Putative 4-diphosphocytidyl-2-C-methyl-D-erythritol kinase [Synechococcus sp. CBW1107]
MAELIVRAPAKINLHLEVLGLRPDGFHELAMVMQTLDLEDRLCLQARPDAELTLSSDRSDLPSDGNNLIVKAADRLRRHVGRLDLGASMRLEKRIPIGAGLAGGSSDAAAALVGLDALWNLQLNRSELLDLAAELGSDVPYCLVGGTQLCFGRGERLEPVPLPEPPRLGVLLIKHPDVSVSTPWAYGLCRLRRQATYVEGESAFEQRRQALRQGPLLAALQGHGPWPPLRNDLQTVVEPEVACVREGLVLLRQAPGAEQVAMSGSGPSLFALFSTVADAERALEHLATPLRDAGFEAWCCRCSSSGVSLDPVACADR